MKNTDIYRFNGKIDNYFECYEKLVGNGVISEDQKISSRYFNIIKDFEYNL